MSTKVLDTHTKSVLSSIFTKKFFRHLQGRADKMFSEFKHKIISTGGYYNNITITKLRFIKLGANITNKIQPYY